ncbi:hypothetical protein JW823_04170 [bacterium]|nr:hypothetical protein [candidate division CSSED10-310 bacterium]
MKRRLPMAIMFLFAIWGGISVFVGKTPVKEFDNLLRNKLLMIVGAFAIILGLGSLIFHHTQKIKRRARFWQYSYITLFALLITSFIGLFGGVRGEGGLPTIFGGTVLGAHEGLVYAFTDIKEKASFTANPAQFADPTKAVMELPREIPIEFNRFQASLLRQEIELRNTALRLSQQVVPPMISPVSNQEVPYKTDFKISLQALYEGILVPCASTMFAMLAFYMCSAAYRAFRMRNLHAGILLVSSFIVMLGQIPLATAYIPGLHELRQWILDVPNLASKRGIMIGVGLGASATSFKIILGIERAWLGGGDE